MAGNWRSGRKVDPNSKTSLTRGDGAGGKGLVRADRNWATKEVRDPAYVRFAKRVGGRAGLRELASYSTNPKAIQLMELLEKPEFKSYGIKALARRVGMTLPELCDLFRNKHFMETFIEFFEGMPEIAKGTVEDAKPRFEVCPICFGEKIIVKDDTERPCPRCKATGEIRIAGNKDARRDVFKVVGIMQESAPPIIANQTNITIEQGVGDFESMIKAAKDVATPIKPKNAVITVEPINEHTS